MTPKQLRETLTLALADRAPKAHAAMKATGTLPEYLDSLIGATWQSLSETKEQIGSQAASRQAPFNNEATLPQMLNSAFKDAEAVAMQQAIEQIDSLQARPEITELPLAS